MNFTEIKARVAARGFARVGDAVLGDYVNDAVTEVDALENWPYLEAGVSGVAPVAISDLREVDQVFDNTTGEPLDRRSYAELINDYGDLSVTGAPCFWYKATPAGVPTVATVPVSTRQIDVQYYRYGPVLSAGSDEPLAPDRFHSLYVLVASRMAHADKGDRATAESIQVEVDRAVLRMRVALLPDDAQAYQIVTDASVDG